MESSEGEIDSAAGSGIGSGIEEVEDSPPQSTHRLAGNEIHTPDESGERNVIANSELQEQPLATNPGNSTSSQDFRGIDVKRDVIDEIQPDDEDDGAVDKFEDDDDEKYLLSDSSSDTETNDDPVQIVPKVNCPEKIILCLDLSAEMNSTPFVSKDGTRYQSLQMVKRAMNIFVHTKAAISRKHQFALIVLQDNALWMHNFTSNTEEFCYVLADLESETEFDTFDMSSLFDVISERTQLPVVPGDIEIIPPPYIIRTVMIYGRSHCMPEFSSGKQAMQSLMQSPYFFLDAFYIHEMPSEDNKCEVIFDRLCDLDERGTSYVFEVGRNPTYLHDNMAKLVAHPLQRPIQKDISYKLY